MLVQLLLVSCVYTKTEAVYVCCVAMRIKEAEIIHAPNDTNDSKGNMVGHNFQIYDERTTPLAAFY